MRLLIDGRVLEGSSSGVRDIAAGLVEGLRTLQRQGRVDVTVATVDGSHVESDIRLPARLFMHAWLPLHAVRGRFDRIVVPRQTVPFISPVRRVPVFHDVGFIDEPALYPDARKIRATTRFASGTRDALAVSKYTADRMARLRLNNRVVPLPIGAVHEIRWRPETDDPYLLCIAAQEPHKNLPKLLEAWGRLDDVSARLVICGRPGRDSAAIDQAMSRLRRRDSVEIASGLSDSAYEHLLAGAVGYVQPSLYEGLCIPAMDMAAAGVPMVVGDVSNLGARFVGAPVGQAVDATNVDVLAAALDALLHDERFRQASGTYNRANIRNTDWVEVGEALLEAIE